MPRTAALVATVALAVSGCGAPDEPAATTPTVHAQADAQREVLTKALSEFRRAPSGTYESEVTADGVSQPLAHETGSYRLSPVAAQFERAILGIDEASSKPRVQVVRVRSSANAEAYLQLKEWGSWTGCWLKTDMATLARLTGLRLLRRNPLPTAITVLAKATVVGAGSGMDTPHLAVNALSALQLLGVSDAAIAAERDALAGTQVPLLLDVTASGAPSGVAVEGSQVADALGAAGLTLRDAVANYVAKAHAQVVLADLGKPVRVVPPGAALLLPRHPGKTATCPANE